jgi:hypothetical protein
MRSFGSSCPIFSSLIGLIHCGEDHVLVLASFFVCFFLLLPLPGGGGGGG